MRIFWFNTEANQDPLTLVYSTTPSRELLFPPEITKKIIDYLPRSSLPSIASVSKIWYATVMPILYKHIYIRTLPHWILFVRTITHHHFQFAHYISSLVLKPSPKLISAQLTSYLNQSVVPNNDQLQPSTRGYVRLERVNYDLTGLEGIDTPMSEETLKDNLHENYLEIDDTEKEYEWLTLVTTQQLVSVLEHCPAIEYLNLSGCENLEDDFLIQLAATKTAAAGTTHVRPLKGIWLSLLRNVSPKGIESLLNFEKKYIGTSVLRHLDLAYNINLNEDVLGKIVAYWGPTLTHIRLDTIYEISDKTMKSIATYCTNLKLLHVSRCWNITNTSMRLLASHCKYLQYISLAFLSQVNEEGIRALIHLDQLQWLNITGCGINPLLKPIFLDNFANYRRQHALIPIQMQDGSVNLI